MSSVETCAICQEVIDISKSVLTSCNHRFHSECFFKWLKKKPNCPMCRTIFREPNNYEIEQEREILYNLRMDIDNHEELLEEIKGNLSISTNTSDCLPHDIVNSRVATERKTILFTAILNNESDHYE